MGRKKKGPKRQKSSKSSGSMSNLRGGFKSIAGGKKGKKKGKGAENKMVNVLLWVGVIFAIIFFVLSQTAK